MGSIVVKLGSSLVASDDGQVRADVLEGVCDQVASLHAAGGTPIVVTSGAIARGMGVMSMPVRPRAMDELQAASAVGQGRLYRAYEELLAARGLQSAQILLTFFDLSGRIQYLNARATLRRLLEWRVVPVINENDTTATDEISFGNNDFLAAQVAILMGAELLILLTDADGVFTADPRTDPAAELIPWVEDFESLAAHQIGHAGSPIGSGGMRSKVVAAEMATAAGIPVVIAGGRRPGVLLAAASGEPVGTRFPARRTRYSSFKLWLRYAKPVCGKVTVDAGAARALRDGGTSLLPVGVLAVAGDFDAGDAVSVQEGDTEIGRGISNLSAMELRRVKGLKSTAVRELLPSASEEAVHRDYFVLS